MKFSPGSWRPHEVRMRMVEGDSKLLMEAREHIRKKKDQQREEDFKATKDKTEKKRRAKWLMQQTCFNF